MDFPLPPSSGGGGDDTIQGTSISNRIYNLCGPWRTEAGDVHTANQIYWHLFYVPEDMTINQIGARVAEAVGASNFQLAFYEVNWVTVRPTGLPLATTGNLSGASTGVVMGALAGGGSLFLPRGWYFVGANQSDAIAYATYSHSPLTLVAGSATASNASANLTGTSLCLITASVTLGTWGDMTAASFTEAAASRGAIPLVRAA